MDIEYDETEVNDEEDGNDKPRPTTGEDGKDKPRPTTEEDGKDKPRPTTEEDGKDKPRPTTEYDPVGIIKALLAGTRLQNSSEPIEIVQNFGLRDTEAVIGYKSTGMHGKVGLVIDTEFEKAQIYRIKKDVVVGAHVPDIVDSRRAGNYKNRKTKTRWSVDDIDDIRGIAIAVPPGYSENVENLLVPPPTFSAAEKKKMKEEDRKPPKIKLVDVQLLIQWKCADDDGKVLSWENRTGCRTLWKKKGDLTIHDVAKHYEGNYRRAGGRHASEGPTRFEHPPAGSTQSPTSSPTGSEEPYSTKTTRQNTPAPGSTKTTRQDTPDPGSTKTTRQDTPDPGSAKTTQQDTPDSGNAVDKRKEKKKARAEFKAEWCDDRNINPENMSDKQDGSFRASFQVYWDLMNKDKE